MKRNQPASKFRFCIYAVLLITALLSSCSHNSTPLPSPAGTDQSGILVPRAGENIELFAPPENESENASAEVQLSARIAIPSAYIPHQIYEFSLDLDAPDEQVIVYKFREGQDDHIGLLIADYDPIRDDYFISWQSMTKATSLQTFVLYTQDVIGDRQQELVAIGTNNQGEQTLDIFRQQSGNTYGLQFASILSVEADIEADIDVVERNESYNNGTGMGIAFSVRALNQDLESDNPLDMIRSVYTWRPTQNRYLLSFSEKIPGSRVEEDQLAELYSGNLDDYHRFIDGPWEHQDGNRIVFFSRITDSIQLATDDRQLNFSWTDSSRWGFGSSIRIQMENEIIRSVIRRMQVSVLDLNTMVIQLSGEENNKFWSGTYTRLQQNGEQVRGLAPVSMSSGKELYPHEISGLFVSDTNWEMFFSAPYITFRTQDEEKSGGYVIYSLNGVSIMQTHYLNGGAEQKQQFILEYEEYTEDNEEHRIITLQEVQLNSYGPVPVSDEQINLEQVIRREDDE
ncbi:pallilysin-related adhesin [Salinispira pacifica]|uniref:Pallilysin beta barrel domain-containing protein n=1 Tax=Salinispira pacifica TaxID=1307761 RepID=V5WHB0_9SPIO|nr:pallilysin-related adhesin [Salinispira pacifica]AHC15222.1 hypothetical protein L21SP2_1847 [Salinispira pacifica]